MANFFTKETIDLVLSSSDMVSTVGEYTKLERRGNKWWGCCPFHGEKTPSFTIDDEKKIFYCFGCHKGGNIITFVSEMEKLTFPQAVESLAKKYGIVLKYQNNNSVQSYKKDDETEKYIELYERLASTFHYFLIETEQGKIALEYLQTRGVTLEIIKKFKLGYSPSNRYWLKKFLNEKNFSDDFLSKSGLFSKNYPNIAFFSDRIMFPIFNRKGQVVAFGGRILHTEGPNDRKYLNSSDLIQYKKRETLFAFNFAKNSVRDKKSIIFCEGYMDCIAYHQAGIENAVAPLGTSLTEEQIKMIQGFTDTILLSFDSDNAGQNATFRAILMCRKNNLTVKVIQLVGGKDPSEILLKFGKENLTNQVNNAILDNDYLLKRLSEKYLINSPEGKTKASLEFFEYVDSLQSDILKESCLDLLSQTFNLKPEAVKRDFINRKEARSQNNFRQNNNNSIQIPQIRLDAELRGLIAVIADLDNFSLIKAELTENDFKNPVAKSLFKILEACFDSKTMSIPDILNNCDDKNLVTLITKSISSGAYQSESVSAIIKDTIKFIKKNKIEEQRNKLLQRIKNYSVITEDDQKQLDTLVIKKMELDKQVQSLTK